MYDKADGLKENGILGIAVLHLLRLGRLLRLVQDGLQALGETAPDSRLIGRWRGVVLQQTQQLHRQPRGRYKVVCVVL